MSFLKCTRTFIQMHKMRRGFLGIFPHRGPIAAFIFTPRAKIGVFRDDTNLIIHFFNEKAIEKQKFNKVICTKLTILFSITNKTIACRRLVFTFSFSHQKNVLPKDRSKYTCVK